MCSGNSSLGKENGASRGLKKLRHAFIILEKGRGEQGIFLILVKKKTKGIWLDIINMSDY